MSNQSDARNEENVSINIFDTAQSVCDLSENIESDSREGTNKNVCPALKRLKSAVWNHFTKERVDGIEKAKCNYCGKFFSGGSKNGTSHLMKHYDRCPNVSNSNEQVVDTYTDDAGRILIARMVVDHDYPLNMVEHKSFKRYMRFVRPTIQLPSRNTVKSDILKLYDSEKGKVKHILEKNDSRVAITTDMWTCINQKKGYMVVTTHFINDKWVLQNYVLRFAYVLGSHGSESLSKVLMDTLLEWNLDMKLSAITVDNCSTNDSMVEDVIHKLHRNNLISSGDFVHMRCCAHILNLIVKDGLDVIKLSIEKVRDSVVYWTGSPRRIEIFKENANALGISTSSKLILDCPTRWNSTYFMLQTALHYKLVFSRCSLKDNQYKVVPNNAEWDIAGDICTRLELFFKATELFSGRKYSTIILCFVSMCGIKVTLVDWLNCPNTIIKAMVVRMIKKFDKYWSKMHILMAVVSILDPRSKMHMVEFYFSHIYPNECDQKLEIVRQKLYDLVNEYKSKGSNTSSSTSQLGVARSMNSFFPIGFDSFYHDRNTRLTQTKSELDQYLDEELLSREFDIDIISYWNTNLKYPTLRAIARDLLAIPVSTVASESAFSSGGRIVNPFRSKLESNTLEAIMCTKSWLSGDPISEAMCTDIDDGYEIGPLLLDDI